MDELVQKAILFGEARAEVLEDACARINAILEILQSSDIQVTDQGGNVISECYVGENELTVSID